MMVEGGDLGFATFVFLVRTAIHSCFAQKNGGALALRGSRSSMQSQGPVNVELMDSTLEFNQAAQHGGAIYASGTQAGVRVVSKNSVYRHNVCSGGDGGAVYVVDDVGMGSWTSEGDRYERNNATIGSGGAICAFGFKLDFVLSTCARNDAPLGGGGCVMWDPLADSVDAPSWVSLAPAIAASVQKNTLLGNTAAYSPDIGTPPASINIDMSITLAGAYGSAHVAQDGTQPVYPTPQATLVDYYKEKVVGRFTKGIAIDASLPAENVAKGATAEPGGVLREPIDPNKNHWAAFTKISLTGTPYSGPHNLTFKGTFMPLGGGHSLQRALLPTKNYYTVQIMIRECSGIKYRVADECDACPLNSIRVSSVGPASAACQCNSDYYSDLRVKKDDCSCFEKWNHDHFEETVKISELSPSTSLKVGTKVEHVAGSFVLSHGEEERVGYVSDLLSDQPLYVEVNWVHHGCSETWDWPDNTWCWVSGGEKCGGAAKGSRPAENRYWRTCNPAEDQMITMSCLKCPVRSASLPGSTSTNDCICNAGLFKNDETGECERCPLMSDLKPGIKQGQATDVCTCRANYFSTIQDNYMVCVKCPVGSTSVAGSTFLQACKCQVDHYLLGDACVQCATHYAPHTTTGDKDGVTDPKTGCVCASGTHYAVSEPHLSEEVAKQKISEREVCRDCPLGASCERAGMELHELSGKPGFWRPSARLFFLVLFFFLHFFSRCSPHLNLFSRHLFLLFLTGFSSIISSQV